MKTSDLVLLDTNVIIRFLTNDSPELSRRAELIFRRAKKSQLIIPDFILMEIVWVLLSFYGLKKEEVIEKLEAMLTFIKFDFNRPVLRRAIDLYRSFNISFVDAYLLAWTKTKSISLVTFDRQLKKIEGKN